MDKRVMFAAAGSGKTTYIVENLTKEKRTLIVTYTNSNYENLYKKITNKFDGVWPDNVVLMTYFSFLFKFCYKPFLADLIQAKGILYEPNPNRNCPQTSSLYYMTKNKYLYSNRLSLLLQKKHVVDLIKERIKKYFDEFIIDEIQDIAGRDFSFLEDLMTSDINILLVGDFYQHTFDTSRDGNANKKLFDDKNSYEQRFEVKGVCCDSDTLKNSWRCSKNTCDFVRENIGIEIFSNRPDTDVTTIEFVSDMDSIKNLLNNPDIIKLHYQNSSKFGIHHKNWGDTKGEDHYNDVCVLLNKKTMKKFNEGKLKELPQSTKNKLYVAITRARGNVYFVEEDVAKSLLK